MFLDTSGLLCLIHRREPQHQEAMELFDVAVGKFTHSYVLAEFVALSDVRGVPRAEALSYVVDIQDSSEVELVWVTEALHRQAVGFLQTRLDRRYSLCDAVSFLMMQKRGITEALTTDHHFEQAGLRALLC